MTTRILPTDGEHLASSLLAAATLLREGKLVAFPTETVYGLGANALDEAAVRRVYEVKGRPLDNPMIVHVHDQAQARELMQVVPAYFEELVNEYWPGPLTLIVTHNAAVPDVVTAGLATVAVRLPDHRITRELLRQAGVPVAAPSANVSGRPSPTDARTVYDDLQGRIEAVLDGGSCHVGIESTVLDLTSAVPTILRPGTVTREDLEDVLQTHVAEAGADAARPLSPGMKYRHYAPRADLLVLPLRDDVAMREALTEAIAVSAASGRRVGLLAPERFRGCGEHTFSSLRDGTSVDYARHLYAGLRALDDAGVEVMYCPAIESVGIGTAVMNRLGKAGRVVG
ncbi:MAG: threonylcarbamoyl-AMP synthase [Bacteroidetes bacterium]|nr:threonylcarbamoyl-AMP synthase [Bacteroidota bacterium]